MHLELIGKKQSLEILQQGHAQGKPKVRDIVNFPIGRSIF